MLGVVSGNISRVVKEHIPVSGWKTFPMAKVPKIPPRQRLAKNLKALMRMQALGTGLVADRSGIDPKSVNNMLNARFDPRLSQVEKVANVFGMAAWQLLAFDLEGKAPDSSQTLRLLEHYTSAQDDGRKAIMQVAEIAAAKSE